MRHDYFLSINAILCISFVQKAEREFDQIKRHGYSGSNIKRYDHHAMALAAANEVKRRSQYNNGYEPTVITIE